MESIEEFISRRYDEELYKIKYPYKNIEEFLSGAATKHGYRIRDEITTNLINEDIKEFCNYKMSIGHINKEFAKEIEDFLIKRLVF